MQDNTSSSPVDPRPSYVLGVGASAGGLEALERMFQHMPPNTGMAFVIVQHLSPDFRSLMDELLARWTNMPIHRVEDGMQVAANAIYLIPPRKDMIISEGKLLLAEKSRDHGLSLPIDHFLRSLAQDCQDSAIAVILSGTGSDGSRGIEEIKRTGGLVIAQSARSSKFDGMPNAARETGMVDLTLDPEDIGDALVRFAEKKDVSNLVLEFGPDVVNEEGLPVVFRHLRDRYGLDFSYYKLNTIVRRTERRMQLKRLESIQEYANQLATDHEELDALYRDLLVGVTRFFRDPDAYRQLEAHVDAILATKESNTEFRAWIAGCATGEEAYSISILLHERVQACEKPITLRVFATDVHRRSLETAGDGVYREESLSELPRERLNTYFTATEGGYVVNQAIRQSVVFAQHNIVKDAPFTRMDLITCRNLLIYLQPPAQKKAISLFHFGLRTGGVLFLGPSETPNELEEEFETLDTHWKIYRKRRDVRLPTELRVPLNLTGRPTRASGLPEIPTASSRSNDNQLLGTYDALLTEYMPPALLLNQQNELVHVFGDAGRFMRHRPGRTGRDALELLDAQLRLAVVGAIQQIHSKRKSEVRLQGIRVSADADAERLIVTVRSVFNQRTQTQFLLIVLEAMKDELAETRKPPETAAEAFPEVSKTSTDHILALEAELRYARENLQATIEELETSNEELQATNEELVASNEELQSTNEELQSVNEELYTVNAEHQRKIHELTVMTDDMDNLLASTRVHTIFLDRELRIRKFTPQIAEIFSFVATDLGRPFDNFSHRLKREGLTQELTQVLQQSSPIEADVQDHSGRWFLMRLLPYISKGALDGVLLTLIDISALKQAQHDADRRAFELRLITDHVPSLIGHVDSDLNYTFVNRQYCEIFGKSHEELLASNMRDLLGPKLFAEVEPHVSQVLAGKTVDFEKNFALPNGRTFWALVSYIPDKDAREQVRGFFICKHVVTALKESEQRFDRAVRGTTDGIWDWNLETGRVYYSPRFIALMGLDTVSPEVAKAEMDSRIHPDDLPLVQAAEHALLTEGVPLNVEYRMRCGEDSEYRWFRGRAEACRDADGKATHMSGSIQNIESYRALVCEKQYQVEQRDRFLAMLSHELRNPLGAVVNGCRILHRQRSLPAEFTPVLDAILRQSQQMAALLEDLLDVARITEGKIELQKQVIDLREIVGPAIESVQPQLDAREQKIEWSVPETPVPVDGNAVRLRQVASNLLSNASKYSPPGTAVHLQLAQINGHAELRVKDQGEGIAPEFLRRVFEPFEQLGKRLDRTDGGMGLGLTLAQTLVGLHGGTIEAHSDGPGQGSEFVVGLPLVKAPAREPTLPIRERPRRRALKVVVVEDNADAREMLRRLLVEDGYEVSVAGTGPTGLEQILKVIPDVAIVDIGLPEMDGYAIARNVRSNPEFRKIFMIALTGYGQASDRLEAVDAGFDTHFTKPLDFQSLEELLRGMV